MNIGFVSTEFALLLPLAVFCYYMVPVKFRQMFLLVINLCFYASFGVNGLVIVFVECAIVFIFSKVVKRHRNKILVVLCAVLLFLILALFKVIAKISDSIVAPMGLSFFTLSAIAYIVDVWKEKYDPEGNPLKLLLWLTFFPTITAGPIYRYEVFNKELGKNIAGLKADYDRITKGIVYMIYGYFIKLVIAERVAIPVNYVFDNLRESQFDSLSLCAIAVLYSIQIYADFAGYSAIAIGVAQILGYYVPENFCAPYLSRSVREFWSRWHISLSSWLRDYIYIPLGGNRKGTIRKHVNIVITFLVSGLWHGIGLHFLAWGGMHALFQITADVIGIAKDRIPCRANKQQKWGIVLSYIKCLGTFVLVTIAWIFFRTGVKDAIYYLKEICGFTAFNRYNYWVFSELGMTWLELGIIVISVMTMVAIDWCVYQKQRIDVVLFKKRYIVRAIVIVSMLVVTLLFGIYGDQHDASYFIYRDF